LAYSRAPNPSFSGSFCSDLLEQKLARVRGAHHNIAHTHPTARACLVGLQFWSIDAIGRFWTKEPPELPLTVMTDRSRALLSGCAAVQSPFAFVLSGLGQRLSILLGEPGAETGSIAPLVDSQFPGARLRSFDPTPIVDQTDCLPYCHLIAGVPYYPKPDQPSARLEQIDQLVRGLLYRGNWTLIVRGRPLPHAVTDEFVNLWSARIYLDRRHHDQPETTHSLDRQAALLIEEMEQELQRALVGRSQGTWMTETYLWSDDPAAAAVAVAALAGEDSRADPVRAYLCEEPAVPETGGSWSPPVASTTWLNSRDLAQVVQFPLQEYAGYAVETAVRLDLVPPPLASDARRLEFAWINDLGRSTGEVLALDADRLTGHALIVGTTDSGKTNTCFLLLEKLLGAGVPFLVIEPTKGEYRYLKAAFPDLEVFTLGGPQAPLRVNPFYVPAGVAVQTHIDALLSLFAAAFVLYAPMPYVLETALHEAYEAKGWELESNLCRRGDSASPRAFPTLTDLYHRIDGVIDRLGFDVRLASDVRASLHARINSLRIGAKGLMLDSHVATTLGDIMGRPVVIELGQIGNDEQKAFLMGLLLIMLQEHYIAEGIQVEDVRLRHVTVIEEAHRLLENVPVGQASDFANPRGKAVETFANLISEVRAYGEGFVIVDQSPTRLAPDAVRNTNLKLVHRIVAGEDRYAIARAINLDEAQQEVLVSLPRGRALAFMSGMDRPIVVAMPGAKDRLTGKPTHKTHAAETRSEPLRLSTWAPGSLAELRLSFLKWMLAAAADGGGSVSKAAGLLRARIRTASPLALRTQGMAEEMQGEAVRDLARWTCTELGALYGWSFGDEESCEAELLDAWAAQSSAPRTGSLLAEGTTVAVTPYAGCAACTAPCRYRFFAAAVLDGQATAELGTALADYAAQPTKDQLKRLGIQVAFLADQVVSREVWPYAEGVSVCVLAMSAARAGWPTEATQSTMQEFRRWLTTTAPKESR